MKKLNGYKKLLINILWKLGVKPRKLANFFKVSTRTIYRHLWK
jgi:transcriptional antiterminator